MKNLLAGILLFVGVSSNAQTSVYHEFPDSNAIWNYTYSQFCMIFPGMDEVNYSLMISGDTAIGSQNYKKLHTPFLQVVSSSNCGIPLNAGYQGAFREDTSLKQVYFVAAGTSAEELLYDFNWQVGDTITGALASVFGSTDTIITIDSVLVGTSYRKRWHINDWYDVKVIEGIGSTYGLIVPSPGYVTDMPGYSLTCFSQDQSVLYPPGTTSCEVITNVTEPISSAFSLFPNPADRYFSIAGTNLRLQEVRLIDLTGRSLRVWDHVDSAFSLEGIPEGVYITEFRDADGGFFRTPLIVSH